MAKKSENHKKERIIDQLLKVMKNPIDELIVKWQKLFKGRSKTIYVIVEVTDDGIHSLAFIDSLQVAEELCNELNKVKDVHTVHSEELWIS